MWLQIHKSCWIPTDTIWIRIRIYNTAQNICNVSCFNFTIRLRNVATTSVAEPVRFWLAPAPSIFFTGPAPAPIKNRLWTIQKNLLTTVHTGTYFLTRKNSFMYKYLYLISLQSMLDQMKRITFRISFYLRWSRSWEPELGAGAGPLLRLLPKSTGSSSSTLATTALLCNMHYRHYIEFNLNFSHCCRPDSGSEDRYTAYYLVWILTFLFGSEVESVSLTFSSNLELDPNLVEWFKQKIKTTFAVPLCRYSM